MRPFTSILLVKRRRSRRADSHSRVPRTFQTGGSILIGLLLGLLGLAAAGGVVLLANLTAGLPPVDSLPALLDHQTGSLLEPTRLYDRTGSTVLYTLGNSAIPRRGLALDVVNGEAFSPELVKTIVALVEPEFNHNSALRISDLADAQPQTFAEKLVTDLLLDGSPGSGLYASLRVRLLANQAIARYGRSQILEWYLNSAYFGHLAYGADSAAWLYLGKPASQLDLAESALLGAVLQAPALNPLDAPRAAREGQQTILKQLHRQGVITTTEYQTALAADLSFQAAPPAVETPARAFSEMVLAQLKGELGKNRLERGGLRIITSLDADLQAQAVCTLQIQLSRLAGEFAQSGFAQSEACPAADLLPALPVHTSAASNAQASVVVLDPASGQVLALVGDSGLQTEEIGLRPHPAGSLQTPFLALAGFARGLSPASLVWDIPTEDTLAEAVLTEAAQDSTGGYHGPVRLRTALANDYLTPLTEELLQLEGDTLTLTLHNLGMHGFSLPEDIETTFIGGIPLNPLDVAQAYSVFATLGQLNGSSQPGSDAIQPQLVTQVTDSSGQPVELAQVSQSKTVVSAELAYLVQDVLADESARWPSLGSPNPLEIGRPAGAKLGSANEGHSAWAAGYTRQTLVVVWLGTPTSSPVPLDGLPGAGIWRALLQYASQGQPALTWEAPAGISSVAVCDPSGLLPGAACPNVVDEVFLEGSQPTSADTLYRELSINRETGRLATVFTPPELVEKQTFLIVPPAAQAWAQSAGLPVSPQEYDNVQLPAINPLVNLTAPAQFSFVRGQVPLTGTAAGEGFSSYTIQVGQGINPTEWVTLQEPVTDPVTNNRLALWDTSGLNGLYILRLQAVRTDQRVEAALVQVSVDNEAPQVRIPYPREGQVVENPVTLQADVQDAVGIEWVEWWLDGRKLDARSAEPYVLMARMEEGEHHLQVRAYDLAGGRADSQVVGFTVAP